MLAFLRFLWFWFRIFGFLDRFVRVLWFFCNRNFFGFLFLPWTTLAFAYAQNEGGGLQGPFLALWVVALITDLFFTRQSGSKDSEARLKMTEMVQQRSQARVVDVEVIDVREGEEKE